MFKKIIALIGMMTFVISMISFPTMADAMRVITIGQDLSDEQEEFIINYFGADRNTCQVIYVNNQQEREYVGSWIPLEQIGNITISSAYVQPTNSGGIQVKTANLTYVTGNMIASVLSTAGVKNCNIVAAAPFPVSGTGALTGVMIAYQTAMGEPLDETKRDLAVQEFTVTQQASESIGEQEALQLVNAVKMEVIQSEVDGDDTEQIQQIVDHVIENVEGDMIKRLEVTNIDNSSTIINNGLTEEDKQLILDLAAEIARQDYQYDEMKETLERVEDNLSNQTNININIDNSNEVSADDNSTQNIDVDNNTEVNDDTDVNIDTDLNNEVDVNNDTDVNAEQDVSDDSILSNTNDDLIDPSYQSSTRKEDIAAIEEAIQEEQAEEETSSDLYDMSAVEEYSENPDELPYEEYAEEEYAVTEMEEDPIYEEQGSEAEPWIEEEYQEYPEELEEETSSEEEIIEETEAEKSMVQAAFTPDGSDAVPGYMIRLFIEKADFEPEMGTMDVVGADGTVQFTIDLTDEKQVITVPMEEADRNEFGWTEGTELHIFLNDETLEEGMNLFVNVESEDAAAEVSGRVGVLPETKAISPKLVDEMRVGSAVTLTAAAAEAAVRFEGDPEMIELLDYGDGTAEAHLLTEGKTAVTIHYYDAEENEIRTDEVTIWIYPEKTEE